MLTMHMVDLGLIIKMLYFLDVTSYTSVKNQVPVLTEGNEDVFFNSDNRITEVPTTKGNIKELQELYNDVDKSTKNNVPTLEDKEKNLENMQTTLNSQSGGGNIINHSYSDDSSIDELSSIESNMSL